MLYDMSQKHEIQDGTFHVTIRTHGNIHWCTLKGIPEILIDNLNMTTQVQKANLLAFCILSNHVHFIVETGNKGISAFVQSFKRNSSRDIRTYISDTKHEKVFSGWQRSFHGDWMRDDKHIYFTIRYVLRNAAKHGLVKNSENWPWTSLNFNKITESSDMEFISDSY